MHIWEIQADDLHQMMLKRPADGHKGTFGHALLFAGSRGMAGAAMLAAEACLRSGVGKLSIVTEEVNRPLLQLAVPEAILAPEENLFSQSPAAYDAIGLGPGLGTEEETVRKVHDVLTADCWADTPFVIDADAINILARHPEWHERALGNRRILTPHPGEAMRLMQSVDLADISNFAQATNAIVVLKGHPTHVFDSKGRVCRLDVGNSGMATAGSGDVLTGIVTGLLAQGYAPLHAALLGVWLHGTAGDCAARELTEHCMLARDIIGHLQGAFRKLEIKN